MKSKLLLIVLYFVVFTSTAQDTNQYLWSRRGVYDIQQNDVWTVDILQNVYISHHSVIDKYDSIGTLKFSQSIKSLGEMKQLTPINSMKLVHFSEEQQTLCLFDNTLTVNGNCKELIESEIYNASYIASSERSDKIWVYDNVNSNLKLIDLEGKRAQEIELLNIKGMLGIEDIIEIKERFGKLYILDEKKGIYIFDMYGSFIDYLEFSGGTSMDANDKSVFVSNGHEMTIMAIDGTYTIDVPLPEEEVINFKLRNQTFYLRTAKNVHKYTLQFSN